MKKQCSSTINYDKFLSDSAKIIPPSGIRKFFDIVAEMKDAISLGVGEPDFVTPWSVRDAAIKSLQKGYTQYTSNAGLPALREKISEYMSKRFNLEYNYKNEIIITVGASEAIDIALRAIINKGDEVLVPEPSYVSYSPCVTLCGGVAVPIKCFEKDLFKITPDNLLSAITPKTKAIILPYPNNPTGAIMEEEFLKPIAEILIKNDILVISDEIYSELVYDGKHTSIASLEGMWERSIVINGFSKAFAMTGWRLGYLCAPAELCSVMLKIHQYIIMCANTASQYGGLHALTEGLKDNFQSVESMHKQYDMRRRFMVKSLNDIGLNCFEPKGAFYVFPCVESLQMNGEEFANELLKRKKVAVVPGSAFGDSGNYFVRISYAYSMKQLDLAMKKIAEFVSEIKIEKGIK